MAANDEFPRGCTQFSGSEGGNAEVTYPAIPGIAWKVTAVKCTCNSGYDGEYAVNVQDQNANVFGIGSGNASAVGDAFASVEWDGEYSYLGDTAVEITAYNTGSLNVNLNVAAEPI